MRRAILSAMLLAAGIGLAVIGGRQLAQVHAVHDWPVVIGRIESTEVLEQLRTRNDENRITYSPQVLYSYEVDGEPYQSTRISITGPREIGSDGAEKLEYRYPQGAEVRVYYDPVRPSQAVLERGSYAPGAAFVFAGAFLGLCALISLGIGLWHVYRRPEPSPPYVEFGDPAGEDARYARAEPDL